jgi:hypothetical protein
VTPPAPEVLEDDAGSGGSALLDRVGRRLRHGAPSVYDAAARLGLWPLVGPRPVPEEMLVYERTPRPEIEDAWTRTRLILRALAGEVERDGARFAVVYVPARLEAALRSWELTCRRYRWDGMADRDRVRRRVAQMAAQEGVAFLDLTEGLRREDRGLLGGPYYEYDPHWNARGHAVAAAEVERFLRHNGVIER